MILQKSVLVLISSFNVPHYTTLGYSIPKIKHRWGYTIPKGTKIKVKVSDLPKGSHVKVLCKCDKCGKESFKTYKCYRSVCHFCKCKERIGSKQSETTKRKMCENSAMKGRFGKNHPTWNPLLTKEERIHKRNKQGKWKQDIKKRDTYTCQCCKYVGKKNDGIMIAHHLNNYFQFKNQRNNIDNGITLCKDCHKLLHKIYRPKTLKEDYNKFITYNLQFS